MSYFLNPKQVAQGQLPSSVGILYTAQAAPTQGPLPKTMITEIVICNTDSSARNFTLYAVASGGSPSAANALYSAEVIAANTNRTIACATVLEASGTLRGLADSATKVTYTVSAMELTS